MVALVGVRATPLFSDNFNYIDGNLVGQGPWLQNGTSIVAPIQVLSGRAIIGPTGQDVNASPDA